MFIYSLNFDKNIFGMCLVDDIMFPNINIEFKLSSEFW